MIKVDSCCFNLPVEYAKPTLKDFEKVSRQTKKKGITIYYEIKPTIAGLSKITYNPTTGKVVFDISGKLLPIAEKQLITRDNFEECIKAINNTGLVKLESYEVAKNSIIRKVDFSENIIVPDVSGYLNVIKAVSSEKYNKHIYISRGEDKNKTGGVVFTGTYKSKKERMIFYDKEAETGLQDYAGILRTELNRTTFKSIRTDVNGNNTLEDVFLSNENPLKKIVEKIIKSNKTDMDMIDKAPKAKSLKNIEDELILKASNYDMEVVRQLIKPLISPSTFKRRIKRIEAYKREELTGSNKSKKCFEDIITQLTT